MELTFVQDGLDFDWVESFSLPAYRLLQLPVPLLGELPVVAPHLSKAAGAKGAMKTGKRSRRRFDALSARTGSEGVLAARCQ